MRRLLFAVLLMCGFSVLADVKVFDYPEYRIYAIEDAPNRFPATLFVSADKQETFVQTAKDYVGSVNVFIVEFNAGKRRVMIDAGFGAPQGKLLAEMKQAGIAPESISDILITHVHPDHVGGLADFPNAKIRLAREEYEVAAKSFAAKEKIALFEFDTEVVLNIKALKFAGHTAGHTVFQLGNCFFVGDLVHAVGLQTEHPAFCARFDRNPADAVASRKKALSELKGEWFGAHIPFPGRFVNPPLRICVEHLALDVATPETTAKWWCENLGFHVAAKLPAPPYAIFIVNSSGRFAMELYRDTNMPEAPDYFTMSPDKMHIAFVSDDLEGDVRRLKDAGATLVSRTKNSGNELVMLRDPSGIPIQLVKRAVPLIQTDFGGKNDLQRN